PIPTCARFCWSIRFTRSKKRRAGRCPSVLAASSHNVLPGTPSAGPTLDAVIRPSRIAGLTHEPLLRAITASGDEAIAAYRAWRPSVDFAGPIDGETTALLPQLHGALTRLGLEDPLAGIFKGVGRRAWYENQTLLSSVQPALQALASHDIRF